MSIMDIFHFTLKIYADNPNNCCKPRYFFFFFSLSSLEIYRSICQETYLGVITLNHKTCTNILFESNYYKDLMNYINMSLL